ncbi:hypothetical protein [Kushneria aurantia]|uniref:Single-stranded DNA-binding protein n=1 Tax=Kushneria aurantia TaxID=504092 RepID=A0ABV6G2U2_9GAMM|nr:hypothetical protein [Kushneria aurantia]
MANQMTVRLANVKRYNMDGRQGASVTVMDHIGAGNENSTGIDFSQMSADYSVFDQFVNLGLEPPCNVEVDVDIRMTKDRNNRQMTSLHVVALRAPIGGGNGQASNAGHSRSGADSADKAKATS